jgi:hypothetical protein
LNSQFKSYGFLKISVEVWACSQTLPMQQNLPKIAQNCQNLPKSIQKQLAWGALKYHQKLRFWYFTKNNNSICRRGTKAYAYHLDSHYKNFSYAFFIVIKWPLCVNFNIPPCTKWRFSQGSIHLVGMRFCH